MAVGSLTADAAHSTHSFLTPPNPSFNWFFLLDLIVSGILTLFFLFYFNRLFGTLISYGIRAYTWHYYRAYVDIHALQISLLGGRIFFKGVRYHGVNESIFIHGGFISWRYWKPNVKQTRLSGFKQNGSSSALGGQYENDPLRGNDGDKGDGVADKGDTRRTKSLSSRIAIRCYGLEWFIYNRTAAYESILSGFGHSIHEDLSPGDGSDNPPASSSAKSDSGKAGKEDQWDFSIRQTSASSATRSSPDRTKASGSFSERRNGHSKEFDLQDAKGPGREVGKTSSKLLQLLPVELACTKGAIVVGNENTRSNLAATFDSATGVVEANPAGPFDLYRQILSFQFHHPVIQLRPNPDFKQNQLSAAKSLSTIRQEDIERKRRKGLSFDYKFRRRRIWHGIRELFPYFQSSVESLHVHPRNDSGARSKSQAGFSHDTRWVGLSRYLDDSVQDEHEGWTAVEYGRYSTILDSPSLKLTYYWDIPGLVLPRQATVSSSDPNSPQDINGAPPPEWGLDLKVEGGSIDYGPWADRERVGLQNVFFPNSYRNSQAAKPLPLGNLRQSTCFKINVEFSQETSLRIPTREPSKDWQWKGRADAIRGASKLKQKRQGRQGRKKKGEKGSLGLDIRPFGWLSLRVARDSTISCNIDMVGSESGYHNRLSCDFRDSKVSSSVNHGLLWQCPRQQVTCDLPNSFSWNSLRKWKFKVESQDMELFLLRDHIFLITDLVSDWTSGPPPDYYAFVPYIYNISLLFSNFKIFVNVNDLNIISNPSDLDDNRFLIVKGKRLTSEVSIPLNKYRPERNAVDFTVDLHDGGIDALTPLWDTLHTFMQEKSAATLDGLLINGTYSYYLSTSSELTDTLVLNVNGSSPKLLVFGFLIRSFMIIRGNYFGDDVHFKTLEEFQEEAYNEEGPTTHGGINPNKKSNGLDVIVQVTVDNPCVLLPENIYDHLKSIQLSAASIEADLRFTNYYMDFQLSTSPLKASLESHQLHEPVVSGTQLFIDGLSIYGHRLFGLPPAEPTYVCNWDFNIGRIIGECSTQFLSSMIAAFQSFDLSFDNHENALPPPKPIILHDVTFLRAFVDSVHISVLLDETAFILSSGAISTKFNDWADSKFSKRLSLVVLDVSVAAVERQLAVQTQGPFQTMMTPQALFQTTIELKMAQRKRNITEHRKLQQGHIKVHDETTNRTDWLLFDGDDVEPMSFPINRGTPHSPNMAVPPMPAPISRHYSFMGTHSRYSLETGSNASSKGFIISSDTSSLRSVQKQAAHGAATVTPVRVLDAERIRESASLGLSTRPEMTHQSKNHESHLRSQTEKPSATVEGDSNPWTIPQFSLYKMVLDTSQLPSQQTYDEYWNTNTVGENLSVIRSPFENDQTTQTNFSCEFPSGVRGFCTPKFLVAISLLIERFQQTHPVEIIDSLQKDIFSHILQQKKAMDDPDKTASIAIRVPSIFLKLVNIPDSQNDINANFRDEYNFGVSNLKTEFRTKVRGQNDGRRDTYQQSFTLHAEAKSLSMSVEGSGSDASQDKADFKCQFGDMNFWLATAPAVQSHLQIRTFDAVTSTKSVEHLAFLVRRTTTTVDSITSSFQLRSPLDSERLRMLVYWLTLSASGIPDPTFLTRISSVLRLAPSHLRQHDSWKIISRLRNVYNSLPSEKQQELVSKCLRNDLSLPTDAKSTVLSVFDQWRTWDLAHVEKSYAMQRIWNSFESPRVVDPASVSLSTTVRYFRFSIGPGANKGDFLIEDMSTAISTRSRKSESSIESEQSKKVLTLRSYCSSIALRLRWEMLGLVEGIARTMSNVTLESKTSSKHSVSNDKEQSSELQIVVGTDVGSINLDGINVKLALVGKAIRGSVIHRLHPPERINDFSVLFSAGSGSSEFSSLSRVLMLWRVWDPYVYCAKTSKESKGELANDWKIAGACKQLRYDVREDLLSLTYTADRLIEDEVRHIRQLLNDFNSPTCQPGRDSAEKRPTRKNQFRVALFLDDYRISFHLLPSLVYSILGYVARLSLGPAKSSTMEVDFDVKQNFHTFLSEKNDKLRPLSVLEIPPINGRILARQSQNRINIEVDTTIELIRLEASALRSLIPVLTGPALSHMISDVKENVEVLQLHLDDVLGSNKPSQPKEPLAGREILYKARLTMAGMEVHVTAPGANRNNYFADMGLSLGMTQIHLDNGLEQDVPMKYPQFSVEISQILFDLSKRGKSRNRSYGRFAIDARIVGTSAQLENGDISRAYHISSKELGIELFAETAVLIVDIASYLQERIKTMGLSREVKRFRRLRRHGQSDSKAEQLMTPDIKVSDGPESQDLFSALFSLGFENIHVAWNMAAAPPTTSGYKPEDLVFSIKHLDLSSKKKNTAKLRIQDMQLQMVPASTDRQRRSLNSLLSPELIFNVACFTTGQEVRVAFQAAGKSLDLRLTSDFMLPGSLLQKSVYSAIKTLHQADPLFFGKSSLDSNKQRKPFRSKRLRSVLMDLDFAGAIVSLQGKRSDDQQTAFTARMKESRMFGAKYGQYVQGDAAATATFRAPGVALKVQFEDKGDADPALNAELKIDASTNVVYPTLVPLIRQLTATLKDVLEERHSAKPTVTMKLQPPRVMQDKSRPGNSADSIIGNCKINVGLLIRKQEFSLSCQPAARVTATAKFDSIYATVNTVQSGEHERFVSLLATFNSLQASVKHVYSNESTASLDVRSIAMSLMNNKHLGSTSGAYVVLKVSPVTMAINARQVQDFLLFREIWLPSADEPDSSPAAFQTPSNTAETQAHMVQRYQQVASAPAFPWNSAIAIEKLEVQLDLGSTLGKSYFEIHNFWLSSKKTSDWEQTLYVNFDTLGAESKGRASGSAELKNLRVRTSIHWPDETPNSGRRPLIQASIQFDALQGKASFDYQPFLVVDIAMFEFLMYNVQGTSGAEKERLFSILDGEKVLVYCTTLTASQSMALFQAWQRLAQDKQAAYDASLREVDRFLRRKSSAVSGKSDLRASEVNKKVDGKVEKAPISLQTSVVVTIKTFDAGVFPSTFFDKQIFKLEAFDAQARFAVSFEGCRLHSALGLTLGRLSVALSHTSRISSENLEELTVHDVVNRATNARGGTILKVPRLVASMETWQAPGSPQIDYTFTSTFEGKVDVGWNYSRISFIRDMWESHSRALASRLGKPVQPLAVRITGGVPSSEGDSGTPEQQEKITAVVNVPQSKYTYTALVPPVIQTPQLRDMGEATPPLEWIGLQRDKLPNVTHQMIIVTLLEVAKEVEDAYGKILGSSS
ncbi:hypothetical protein MPDQ_003426 [Monascus purpureus]|uniref:Uncharacterized protein n=1 Tax=Monascus purpureus TaxID=5098 RepID=A0A507QMU5_MONPU|nr:hypothetical protein MPDQ_003426 [Monascus purpureus]